MFPIEQQSAHNKTFSHIRMVVDARFPHKVAQVLPGQYFASEDPMVVYTVLGSCISACINDPVAKVGGINHFMLAEPKTKEGRHDSWGESARYGNYAMELLLNELMKLGGIKERMEVKIFGGAKLYESSQNVGKGNSNWVIDYMKTEGFNVVTCDVGDIYPRKLYYFTETGRLLMKKIKKLRNETILVREEEYKESLLRKRKREDDVTLF